MPSRAFPSCLSGAAVIFTVAAFPCPGPLLRAAPPADPDDVFVASVRRAAAAPPLAFEAVHDGVFPSYYDWRKAALRRNLDVARGVTGEKIAEFRLTLRDPAFPRREESFIHRAREEAARLGANLLCSPDAGLRQRAAMDFDVWRLRMDDAPLPAAFVGLLTETSFRDNAYLKKLLAEWTARPRPSGAATPAASRAASPVGAATPPAAPGMMTASPSPTPPLAETTAISSSTPMKSGVPAAAPRAPAAEAAPADATDGAAGPPASADGAPVESLEISLIRQRMAEAATAPISTTASRGVPPSSRPDTAAPPAPSPALTPAFPSTESPAPPALRSSTPPAEAPLPPEAVQRRRAIGAGALSLAVPGLGQWAAGEKGRGARTFLGQAALVTVAAAFEQNVRRNVDRGLDDIYAYRAARYGAAAAWFSQAAATSLRLWTRRPGSAPTAGGAFSRSLAFPGWGHLHAGYYETGLNVMAWEGFVVYWGTKAELGSKERVALLAATHWGQALLAGLMAGRPLSTGRASPRAGRPDGGLAFDITDGTPRLVLSKRFGGVYAPPKVSPVLEALRRGRRRPRSPEVPPHPTPSDKQGPRLAAEANWDDTWRHRLSPKTLRPRLRSPEARPVLGALRRGRRGPRRLP